MLSYYKEGKISLEKIAEKMSHAVADCFNIKDRGFIREGYFADLVMVNLNQPFSVKKENILYKCGWSPLEGTTFSSTITNTFVNGNCVFANEANGSGLWNITFDESNKGQRLSFNF
jgi:dihydroorotase